MAVLIAKAQEVEAAKEDAVKKQSITEDANIQLISENVDLEKEKPNTEAVLN